MGPYEYLLLGMKPFLVSLAVTLVASTVIYLLIWKSSLLFFKKIQYYPLSKISNKQIFREIATVTIGYICVGIYLSAVNFILLKMGWSKTYSQIEEFGWWWYGLTFVFVFIIHDAYAFWTHWLMHNVDFFKSFHTLHHRSIFVTSFSGFAFSVREFILIFSWLPLIKVTIPMHYSVTFYYSIFFIIYNSLAHSGARFYPISWFSQVPFKWLNYDHHIHHQNMRLNLGLYFSFWDRLMNSYQEAPLEVIKED